MSEEEATIYMPSSRLLSRAPVTLVQTCWLAIILLAVSTYAGLLYAVGKSFGVPLFDDGTGSTKLSSTCQEINGDTNVRNFIRGMTFCAVVVQTWRTIIATASRKLTDGNTLPVYLVSLTVMCICCCSELLQWNGWLNVVCSNALGVTYPIVYAVEWQITVPTMTFLCTTMDPNKKTIFNRSDCYLFLNAWLHIVTGILIPLYANRDISIIATTVSLISFILYVYMSVVEAYEARAIAIKELEANNTDVHAYMSYSMAEKRCSCVLLIMCVFPLFAVAFFGPIFGYLTNEWLGPAFGMCSFAAKVLFNMLLMEGQLGVLDTGVFHLLSERKNNRDRRAFIRYVCHEMRSPLNSLTMGVSLLGESGLQPMQQETMGFIRESVTYIRDTINDVFTQQTFEESLVTLKKTVFGVENLLNDALNQYSSLLDDKMIQVKTVIKAGVPKFVYGDRTKLFYALGNLLSNAVKFSQNGSPITITVTYGPGGGGGAESMSERLLTISVADLGAGVPDNDRAGLFVPFLSLKKGELKIGRGSGVGLSVVKDLVTLHGGTVSHKNLYIDNHGLAARRSRDNPTAFTIGGSEFSISVPLEAQDGNQEEKPTFASDVASCRLPIAKADSFTPNPNSTSQSNAQFPQAKTNPVPPTVTKMPEELQELHFLVVDDVSSNRKILTALLKKRGFHVTTAEDGAQALEIIKANPNQFDVIFMDNMMPNVSGVEATREMRDFGFENIVMGLTGNTHVSEIQEFEDSGADVVLPKPLTTKTLDALITFIKAQGSNNWTRHKSGRPNPLQLCLMYLEKSAQS